MVECAMHHGGQDNHAEAQLRAGLLYMFRTYAAPHGLWSDNHGRDGHIDTTETRINGPNVCAYPRLPPTEYAANIFSLS